MLVNTKGIVLRSVKYGETSLILSVFTEVAGVQSYMVKGIRGEKMKSKRAGLLQPTSLIEFTAEHRPGRGLQHIREFQPAYLYQAVHEQIIKNAVAVYAVELLLRMLPQEEIMQDLFHFAFDFLQQLDQTGQHEGANYPLFFTIQCGKYFGYNVSGAYSAATPYLNATEGLFTDKPPQEGTLLQEEDIALLARFIAEQELKEISRMKMNAATRNRLLDWYLEFLQHHTQHLSAIRSLDILRTILR